MKKLTMKDIGILANVSQSTVSRVMSGHPNVKEEIKKEFLNVLMKIILCLILMQEL